MMKYLRPCLWALSVLWKSKTIEKGDRIRLWRKTINLFLCFVAFADRKKPRAQIDGAMTCAILSALYDYETDWVPLAPGSRSIYRELLEKLVSDPRMRELAWNLFCEDLNGKIDGHGLARGSDALLFYRTVIGSEWLRKYSDEEIALYGRCLQIIDDILDLDEDAANGHTNCLLTAEREGYLREAGEFARSCFCRTLESNSLIYYRICFRLFGPRIEGSPKASELLRACRPVSGLFAFILALAGFKALRAPLLPAIPAALAMAGITVSIMVFNDLMDKDRDREKGKDLASRYPWHIFRLWKWTSGMSAVFILIAAAFCWKQAVFCLMIWIWGLAYSVAGLPYPFNNVLVAVCAGAPVLLGMAERWKYKEEPLLIFFIIVTTILLRELIKDMRDKQGDIGYKDTLATRASWPTTAAFAVLLCYIPIIGLLSYPDAAVRPLVYCFGLVGFYLGLAFTRTKAVVTAERAIDLFLALFLIVLTFK